MSFATLRDLCVASVETAAYGWRAHAKTLTGIADDLRADVSVPLRRSWQGDASAVARQRIREQETPVGDAAPYAMLIARTLFEAASRWRLLQDRLVQLTQDAHQHGLIITDAGVSVPAGRDPDQRASLSHAAGLLRKRVTELLIAATDLDKRIASILAGLTPFGSGHNLVSAAQQIASFTGLDTAIPAHGTDPGQAAKWWAGLSEEDRLILCEIYPKQIGWLDGLPATDRDRANRLYLDQQLKALEDLGSRNYPYQGPGIVPRPLINPDITGLKHLLDRADTDRPERMFLLGFDESGDGRAIVAVGNPDTARHTAVWVPGLETDLGDVSSMMQRVSNIAHTADNLTAGAAGDVSVIGWLGYDAPEASNTSVLESQRSVEGGAALDSFVNGLNTAHDGSPSHMTAIGHSYGSTVVGEAAKTGDGLAAADIITAGSPGMHVDHASQLNLDPHHVWAGSAPDDPVSNPASHAGTTAAAGALLNPISGPGAAIAVEDNLHGPSPHYEGFGANQYHVDTFGHSDYWKLDTKSLEYQAAIVVGRYKLAKLDHGQAPEEIGTP